MNPPSIQTVLTNLISLTNERDVFQLESLLAKSLQELIQPLNTSTDNSVIVYRAVNVSKQQFKSDVNSTKQEELSDALKESLADCFNHGEFVSITAKKDSKSGKNDSEINLYPLKNSNHRTVAVIAIEAEINNTQLHDTITMLLQIHQNFAGLINDNEHDTLTGLLNRKTFEPKLSKLLEQMLKSAKRQDDKQNSAHFLALFDIDNFKLINDEYGHVVGDEVLAELSAMMKSAFRDKDLLFRYGGEEFLGVFECANPSDIYQLLERFRVKVAEHNFQPVGQVTISIGFTEIFTYDNTTDLVSRADQALYHAKDSGRNSTYHFEELVAKGALVDAKENTLELT